MSVTPRPEFGKPETGRVRHWFRTDAQMRRHYLSPEARDAERQRIGERRKQMKAWREQEAKRPKPHDHAICRPCHLGLVDVGIHSGSVIPEIEAAP